MYRGLLCAQARASYRAHPSHSCRGERRRHLHQNGIYTTPLQNPAILGRDAVGRVVQCGAEVSDFHEGDLVWTNSMGYDGRQGVASQYALVPADRLYPAPKMSLPSL